MPYLINYNGKLFPADQPIFGAENRSFRYGDGFFESIRMINGKCPFLNDHVERINLSLQLLRMEPEQSYSLLFFEKQIKELSQESHIKNGRIRISIFRSGGGYYKPNSAHPDYLMEIEPLEAESFELNDRGLVVGICEPYRKDFNLLSPLKSSNALIYVMASQYYIEKGWDDCIILNSAGRVVEATSSNIIVFKNNILYTPAFTEGCVAGIMKEIIISIANKLDIDFQPAELELDFIKDADEILLTNAVQGIKWIGKWEDRFYKNDLAKVLVEKLNELTK